LPVITLKLIPVIIRQPGLLEKFRKRERIIKMLEPGARPPTAQKNKQVGAIDDTVAVQIREAAVAVMWVGTVGS
jgi:hypothetical protein